MRVRFWGVRGSVPWSSSNAIRYGCNTPCVEVLDEASGALLVLDAGTGIVALGGSLGTTPRDVPILLTHYHWDHVQGLPFFAPFYQREWRPTIWAPALGTDERAWINALFEAPFFPVPVDSLLSRPTVRHVRAADELTIGGFGVRVQPLTHPGGAFAYRVSGPTGDLVYATDHEFGDRDADDALAAFCLDARAVILDAHFTPEELPAHQGYGHGTWQQCAQLAAASGAGHLWLFHHKPGRSDAELKAMEDRTRGVFPAATAAMEGQWFEV